MKTTIRNRQYSKMKRLGGIFMIAFSLLLFFTGCSGGQVSTSDAVKLSDHIKGNQKSSITLIEYGDFQCPACAQYHTVVKEIAKEYKDEVKIAYRHFPLSNIHPHAQLTAQAAEAAGIQGKFWEMHDKIFEGQKEWSKLSNVEDVVMGYAEELELNMDKFKADMNSSSVKEKVSGDYKNGIKAGVKGTPSFILNGEEIRFRSVEEFGEILESLKEKPLA